MLDAADRQACLRAMELIALFGLDRAFAGVNNLFGW